MSWKKRKGDFFHAYIGVLVGSDSYELSLWKSEALSLYVIVIVLHPVLRHLHDVQPRLVLVQRLQDNHLHEHGEKNYEITIKNHLLKLSTKTRNL